MQISLILSNLVFYWFFPIQVIQLYTRGWDELAETKLNSLAQPSSMGKTLLLITGTRLNEYIKDKPDVYSRVVSIGTLISSYLETLVSLCNHRKKIYFNKFYILVVTG